MPSRSTRRTSTTASPQRETPIDFCCSVCDRLLFVKSDDPPSPVTPWRCLACDQFFTVKSSVKRHVAKSHYSSKFSLICQNCAISSASNLEFAELNSETADAVAEMEEDHGGVDRTSEEGVEGEDTSVEIHQEKMAAEEETTQEEHKHSEFFGQSEENIEGDLALLALMLQHNLNLDVMESIISVLKSGFNFSALKNSKHWLQRLGKGASFNVKTCCERCSHLDVQMVFGNGQSATISSQLNQNETSAGSSHEALAGNGAPEPQKQGPKSSKQSVQISMPPTTWKTVALQALRDNYSKEEILNLFVDSGKGKRDADTEEMEIVSEEKRFLIFDAVEKFSTSIGNHPPTETALNHYLSQALSDLRRNEQPISSGNLRKKMKTDSFSGDGRAEEDEDTEEK